MNLEEIYIAKKAIEEKFNSLADDAELKDYEKLNDELNELSEKEKVLLKKEELRKAINEKNKEVPYFNIIKERANSDKDYRTDLGDKLKKGDSINITSKTLRKKQTTPVALTTNTGVIIPDYTSDNINPGLQTGNFLVDKVQTMHFNGGDSFTQRIAKHDPIQADYTKEAERYKDISLKFASVPIQRCKITDLIEISEETETLPPADYYNYIQRKMVEQLKRKISLEILVGEGTVDNKGVRHMTGILHNPTNANEQVIDPTTDMAITTITDSTLDEILFSYGSENTDVYDDATLLLNKQDLGTMFKMKEQGTRINQVDFRNKAINGTEYYVTHALKSMAIASANDYVMIYGHLLNYLLVYFSDIELARSPHERFSQGIVTYRASVHVGGNVVVENGFTRVKKG